MIMIFYLKGVYNINMHEVLRLICLNLSSVEFWNFLNSIPSYLRNKVIAAYVFIAALAI